MFDIQAIILLKSFSKSHLILEKLTLHHPNLKILGHDCLMIQCLFFRICLEFKADFIKWLVTFTATVRAYKSKAGSRNRC